VIHAKPCEVINVGPLGPALKKSATVTLAKTDSLEVIRLVVPAAKEIATHSVPGEVTIQCLEGEVGILAHEVTRILGAGQMLYLAKGEPHAVRGIEDASLLVTILLG